jgi:glucose/arabinose dehydrogenase
VDATRRFTVVPNRALRWLAGPGVVALLVACASAAARDVSGTALVRVPLAVPAAEAGAPFDVPRALLLPAGWRAEVWERVGGGRFAAWTPDGQLLVSVPAAGEVVLLQPRATRAAPPRERLLLSGLLDPEGLAFDVLGGRRVLYVAEADQLDRYTWPGLRRTVVTRLPDPDGLDRLKGLAVGRDHTLYVGIGSDSLLGGPRGVVLAIRPDGRRAVALGGVHYAEGLAVGPDGRLWLAANSAGAAPDAVVGLGGGRRRAARLLPPHTAPLGLAFVTGSPLPLPWRRGAVLAAHGARNPALPSRPAVLWMAWNGAALGPPTTLVGGFEREGVRWGRPSDAVAGSDGALYVVDDTAGAVYRLTPPR